MGVYAGPDVSESGLVLALDGANYKSFKGSAATNILVGISPNQTDQNDTFYKVTNGTETVYIPSIGYVNSKYVDFYNDYSGGSGACCPNLFSYGTGLAVSPSTTYTYSIIYKTTTGYSHPNYMYRYEYNGSGGFVIESGIHNTSNRTSLGNDWWFAWGQFTTQATTATLNTFMFHYEYATQNRIYVYKAALYSGSHIIPYQYMLDSGQIRGTTVATGGGWADLTGNGNHGELVNGVREDSANLGALVFDGSDDRVETVIQTYGNNTTWEAWVNRTSSVNGYNMFMGRYLPYFGLQSGGIIFSNNIGGSQQTFYSTGFTPANNTWYYLAFTTEYDGANTIPKIYINGVLNNSTSFPGAQVNYGYKFTVGDGYNSTWYPFQGKISNVKVYNRALTAQEIQQNFNANRSRFGI